MPIAAARPARIVLAAVLATLAAAPPVALASPSVHIARHHRAAHRAPSAVVAANLAGATSPGGACADAQLIPSSANLDRAATATLCLINQQRALQGLAALRPDAALTAAAARHSQDMAAHNYFGHVGPAGDGPLDRIRAAGYLRPNAGYTIGENIAAATGDLATPAAIVNMWMKSAGHRANILNPAFKDTGLGLAPAAPASLGNSPGATYTQDFGATH